MRIAFIIPDYHCSYVYAEELNRLGHKAIIYVPENYPKQLLFSEKNTLQLIRTKYKILNQILKLFTCLYLLTYRTHIYYGEIRAFHFGERYLEKIFNITKGHNFFLDVAKFMGVKIIYVPSGCNDEELKSEFIKLDDGNVCHNCGVSKHCQDITIKDKFEAVRKYSNLNVGLGCFDSTAINLTHFKYKSLDLNVWNPNMIIPEEHLLKKCSGTVYILHSFADKNRINDGKNEKGSQHIAAAVDRLKSEGRDIEYIYLNNVHTSIMRYYQVQADIIVEQLIYGWWGSTGVEAMALGKPTVCYLREGWKKYFKHKFKYTDELPIIEANTKNIYQVLQDLLDNNSYRQRAGWKSREFAIKHFDVKHNALNLVDIVKSLR